MMTVNARDSVHAEWQAKRLGWSIRGKVSICPDCIPKWHNETEETVRRHGLV